MDFFVFILCAIVGGLNLAKKTIRVVSNFDSGAIFEFTIIFRMVKNFENNGI